MTELLVFLLAVLPILAANCALLVRNTTVWKVRNAFIDDDELFADAYNALPSYEAMLYNPRYWPLSTKRQWVEFVRTKGTVK